MTFPAISPDAHKNVLSANFFTLDKQPDAACKGRAAGVVAAVSTYYTP